MNRVAVGEMVRQELLPPPTEMLSREEQIDRVLFLTGIAVTAETALQEIPDELVIAAAERHITDHYQGFGPRDTSEESQQSEQLKDSLLMRLSSEDRSSVLFGAQLQLNGQTEARQLNA